MDFSCADRARNFVSLLSPADCLLKVGKELFVHSGPEFVTELIEKGYKVFLDLKFHDIPTTVARACQAAADLGVFMLNVHALGSQRMLEAAANSLANRKQRPLLLAVTALTSWDDRDLQSLGIAGNINNFVLHLVTLTYSCGLDGVVCSAKELCFLHGNFGCDFYFVTPGIRLCGEKKANHLVGDDQSRIVTPTDAIEAGASYLVIGRPITQASDPKRILDEINKQLGLK